MKTNSFFLIRKKQSSLVMKILFFLIVAFCLTWFHPLAALLIGLSLGLFIGVPYPKIVHSLEKYMLQSSIVLLGFGMNIAMVAEGGWLSAVITFGSIVAIIVVGWFFGKIFKIPYVTRFLICCGTAICGGSAIAAIAPLFKDKRAEISIALVTIFILNAADLFIFPFVGKLCNLTGPEFGLWAALSIHDTSSVVASCTMYDNTIGSLAGEALKEGVIVKLTRALWIIPMVLATAAFLNSHNKRLAKNRALKHKEELEQKKLEHYNLETADMKEIEEAVMANSIVDLKGGKKQKLSIPWFIFYFVGAMLVGTWVFTEGSVFREPLLGDLSFVGILELLGKKGLVLALFCIGSSVSLRMLRDVGIKPFIMAIALWILMSGISLWFIVMY